MVISTYDQSYGGMDHWASAAYVEGANGNLLEAAAGVSARPPVPELPGGLARRTELFARASLITRSAGSAQRPPRARSARPVRSCNTFSPFQSREPPRGKFSSFPASITRVIPKSPDPLGFTPYGPSTASGLAGYAAGQTSPSVRAQGIVPWQEGQQGAARGRANRFPPGGYMVHDGPIPHAISMTEDMEPPWSSYEELEEHPRGRASRYPRDLDPYPAFEK
mmetsp:Transcript_82695/g.145962  ORF Transcript_82695/g.145962 Transcript_82695/m.145962 type:complete len:222 (+) Transcript_82695:58-723(+)